MRTVEQIINSFRRNLQNLNSPIADFPTFGNVWGMLRSVALTIAEQDSNLEDAKSRLSVYTATGVDLDDWAKLFNMERKLGTKSQGYILVSSQSPITLSKGTIFGFGDIQIKTTQDQLIVPTEVAVPVEALLVGRVYNLEAGSNVKNSILGVTAIIGRYRDSAGNAQVGLRGGLDNEVDSPLRNRLLNYYTGSPSLKLQSRLIDSLDNVTRVEIVEHQPITGYITIYIDTNQQEVLDYAARLAGLFKSPGIAMQIKTIKAQPVDVILKVGNPSSELTTQLRLEIQDYISTLSLGQTFEVTSMLQSLTIPAVCISPLNNQEVEADTLISLGRLILQS